MNGNNSAATEWCLCELIVKNVSTKKTCLNSEALIEGKRKENPVCDTERGREEAARSHQRRENKSRCEDYKDCTNGCSYQRVTAFPFSPLFLRGYINQNRRYKSSASAIGFCGQSERPEKKNCFKSKHVRRKQAGRLRLSRRRFLINMRLS